MAATQTRSTEAEAQGPRGGGERRQCALGATGTVRTHRGGLPPGGASVCTPEMGGRRWDRGRPCRAVVLGQMHEASVTTGAQGQAWCSVSPRTHRDYFKHCLRFLGGDPLNLQPSVHFPRFRHWARDLPPRRQRRLGAPVAAPVPAARAGASGAWGCGSGGALPHQTPRHEDVHSFLPSFTSKQKTPAELKLQFPYTLPVSSEPVTNRRVTTKTPTARTLGVACCFLG